MSQSNQLCAGKEISFTSKQCGEGFAAGEKKTYPIFEGGVDILFKPTKPKAGTPEKPYIEPNVEKVVKMVGMAIGIDAYDTEINPNANCWNCTMDQKKNEESSKIGSVQMMGVSQFSTLHPLISCIKNVHTFNNKAKANDSIDNSPLVMWTMTSLFLHVCLWIGSKLCTRCKSAVFYYLFENFKNIIDSMVNNIKNLHKEESTRVAMDFLLFQKFANNQNTKQTGHDSLGAGIVSKAGSAKFLWHFIRFMVTNEWDGNHPTNKEIMTIKTSADNKVLLEAKEKTKAEEKTSSHDKNLIEATKRSSDMRMRAELANSRKLEVRNKKTFKRRSRKEMAIHNKFNGVQGMGGVPAAGGGFLACLVSTTCNKVDELEKGSGDDTETEIEKDLEDGMEEG